MIMPFSTSLYTTFHVLLNTPMVPPEQKQETRDVPLQDLSIASPVSPADIVYPACGLIVTPSSGRASIAFTSTRTIMLPYPVRIAGNSRCRHEYSDCNRAIHFAQFVCRGS
ncbi:hypothetical protein DAEQUDRAFT_412636 [Daedalea quercina L-15889]|uniref:Uncharacterized protein n=1 Tax=Daedalea quercina L-15889 TaxID=1314783 RepID=A0A165NLT9_9APHY|nr:hypothetical protein DAEQUDRAFT_412636 [Daedalea quercina L-15889]